MSENMDPNGNNEAILCRAYLICTFDGRKHPIDGDKRFNIGRKTTDNDVIDLSMDEPIISRKHAVIILDNNKFFLCDTDSKNGTYINGNKLEPNKKYLLKNNDILEFSKIKYRFERYEKKEGKFSYDFGDIMFIDVFGKRRICVELHEDRRIIPYQYKMMNSNCINGLLSIAVMDNEGRSRIYYDIEKMESLSSQINAKGYLSKKQFIQILLDVFQTIRNIRDYLLNPDALLLNPAFIFYDHDEKKPLLVYCPFDITAERHMSLKVFISQLTAYISEEREKDFQMRVLKAVSNENFNLSDFKNIILNEQEECTPDSDHYPKEKKNSWLFNSTKKMQSNFDKKMIILIQAVLIFITGCIIISRKLDTHQYIGLMIIAAAIDIGVIYKYPKFIEERRREKWKEGD